MTQKKFTTFAWLTVAATVAVILWGAFVRATGSGAGCGSHWPTCNGQIIPRPEQIETLIEFAHRVTGAVNGLLVIGLVIGAYRLYAKGHPVRTGAVLSLLFILIEGALGAALVRFEWVVDNVSVGRVIATSVHLVNTSILLAVLTLTAWWAGGGSRLAWRRQGQAGWLLFAAFLGYLLLSASGAITALGDTVFPPETLQAGLLADLDPTAHFLVRLRVWHPVIALGLGVYLVLMSTAVSTQRPSAAAARYGRLLKTIFGVQLLAGFVNVLLLAPVWLQIVHLLLASLLLIILVLFVAEALSFPQPISNTATLSPQTGD